MMQVLGEVSLVRSISSVCAKTRQTPLLETLAQSGPKGVMSITPLAEFRVGTFRGHLENLRMSDRQDLYPGQYPRTHSRGYCGFAESDCERRSRALGGL